MHVQKLAIGGLALITPKLIRDDRGIFAEVHNRRAWRNCGIDADFVQDNQSLFPNKNTIRGLHFQVPPHTQGKLVRVIRGSVIDIAVDIRRGSPTYGQHVSALLSAQNWRQFWIPPGFAHGFCSLEDDTEVLHKLTGYYAPAFCHGVRWDDPSLEIAWPVLATAAIVTAKDRQLPNLIDLAMYFRHEELAQARTA